MSLQELNRMYDSVLRTTPYYNGAVIQAASEMPGPFGGTCVQQLNLLQEKLQESGYPTMDYIPAVEAGTDITHMIGRLILEGRVLLAEIARRQKEWLDVTDLFQGDSGQQKEVESAPFCERASSWLRYQKQDSGCFMQKYATCLGGMPVQEMTGQTFDANTTLLSVDPRADQSYNVSRSDRISWYAITQTRDLHYVVRDKRGFLVTQYAGPKVKEGQNKFSVLVQEAMKANGLQNSVNDLLEDMERSWQVLQKADSQK